jgi:site-specific recombinase XerC
LLAVVNPSTWIGHRDRTLLLVAAQTGLRVSELVRLNCQHVVLGTGAHVRCLGKGRKERCTPLRPEAARMLDAWLRQRQGRPEDPAARWVYLVITRESGDLVAQQRAQFIGAKGDRPHNVIVPT